ncbi:hypothetical protein CBM2599_B120162 [Cupriavidus taiwanensis]|nr:hypothetical protein CBM2599_B120162 [Cupriavidus taiwanensis]
MRQAQLIFFSETGHAQHQHPELISDYIHDFLARTFRDGDR